MPTTAPEAASIIGPPEEPDVGKAEMSMYGRADDVPGCFGSVRVDSYGVLAIRKDVTTHLDFFPAVPSITEYLARNPSAPTRR